GGKIHCEKRPLVAGEHLRPDQLAIGTIAIWDYVAFLAIFSVACLAQSFSNFRRSFHFELSTSATWPSCCSIASKPYWGLSRAHLAAVLRTDRGTTAIPRRFVQSRLSDLMLTGSPA